MIESIASRPATLAGHDRDPDGGHDAGCLLTVIDAAPGALWEEARSICDGTLARGGVFVALLAGAEACGEVSLLGVADRLRADRFRMSADRSNFVLGRTMVHYLVRPRHATSGEASLGPHGKPFLPGAAAYNLSHSGRWVICAISRREPIGVDIETFARLRDHRDLLATIAHPTERDCIEGAVAGQGIELFKRCWTRKEAVLKATGKGLHGELQAIDVRLRQTAPILQTPLPLRLIDLPVGPGEATATLALDPSIPCAVLMRVLLPVRDGGDPGML